MAFDTKGTNGTTSAAELLRWYDKHARELPWRVSPQARKKGARADPYHVWLSEIMLQQTTVATVGPRYGAFLSRWPSVRHMAAAPLEDILAAWAGLGYYARARNLHKCAVHIVENLDGVFPDTEDGLKALPGIGDYTAAAIAAIAFDRRAIVVDGNIERVVSRLFAIDTPLPKAKPEIKARADAIWPARRSGDFAQALMDLGAGICRPKAPLCLLCPISAHCQAHRAGKAETYPIKPAKKKRPTRAGACFVLKNSKGAFLLERRPEKGLLGGMLGVPGTDWGDALPRDVFASAPADVDWQKAGAIEHIFTHFRLRVDVYVADAPKGFRRPASMQWTHADEPLPTVFKKVVMAAAK